MDKDFDAWNELQKLLDNKTDESRVYANVRDVWWSSLGLNIGSEQNGRGKRFTRPMLILYKFNNHQYLGVPLSSKVRKKPYTFIFNSPVGKQSALLSQIRVIDSKRLQKKMFRINKSLCLEILKAIKDFL